MTENSAQKTYTCGTLKYTGFQIVSVFFWMLYGAIAMTMLNSTFRSATPFLFRNYGLSDTFLAVIMGTVFSWINTVVNPVLSTTSDRHRSRLGRRIPFILYTALPTAILLAAMPFYPYLMKFLPQTLGGISTITILLGTGAILYYLAYLFVGIVYFYLIPDVIPAALIGRYYGFFRVSGVLAGIAFSRFLFPFVDSHPRIIYPAVGAFYLVSILLVCFFIREGKYNEVEKLPNTLPWYKKVVKTIAEYGKECFTQSYYWWYYIYGMVVGLHGCILIFMNFFYLDGCNMTMQEIGTLGVYVGTATAISCFVSGFLVDKIGAFYCTFFAQFMMGALYVGSGFFMKDFTTALIWRLPFAVVSGISAVSGGRILVEVFPRSKFGQIASGRNLLISLWVGLVNYPVGLFSDFLKNATPETTLMFCGADLMPIFRGYRFINFWAGLAYLGGVAILMYFYIFHHRKRKDKACDL